MSDQPDTTDSDTIDGVGSATPSDGDVSVSKPSHPAGFWKFRWYFASIIGWALTVFVVTCVMIFADPAWASMGAPRLFVLGVAVLAVWKLHRPRWLVILTVIVWVFVASPYGIVSPKTDQEVRSNQVIRVGIDSNRGDYSGDKLKTDKPQIDKSNYAWRLGGIPIGTMWFGQDGIARFNGESGYTSDLLSVRSIVLLPWPHIQSTPIEEVNGDNAWQANRIKLLQQGDNYLLTGKVAGISKAEPGPQLTHRFAWGFAPEYTVYIGWFLLALAWWRRAYKRSSN